MDEVDEFNVAEAPMFQIQEDEEARQEVNAERAMVSGASALMAEIITWFDAEVAWANSITSLDTESKVPLESQLLAKQRYADFMESAKIRLVTLKNEHLEG
jgi:hypothetical protein